MNKAITITALFLIAGTVHATTTPPSRAGIMRQVRGNIEQNKDVRNEIRTEKKEVVGGIRQSADARLKALGSSTPREMGSTTRANLMMQKKEVRLTARKDIALAQKDALVKRLTQAVENLTQVKTQISAVIDKRVADGKPVGKAKELLATFTAKIETAKKAIAAVVAWKPDTKTASTTEISLTKPRETANTAIKAVQDARLALNALIKELRQANASTTQPINQ